METNLKDFFSNDYINYASYNSSIKIASVIDGLKISQRKILYTCIKNNINSKKVGQLVSQVSDETNYLHGEQSLVNVTVGLAQRFIGTNNIPLLKTDGSFGTRLFPFASAPRYIFTGLEKYIFDIFNKDDENILIKQNFEGSTIEPKFFIPILPMILVNGSIGLAIGFAQNILPRNPIDIIKYINRKLIKQNSNIKLLPYWNGFTGDVKEIENNVFEIYGKYEIQKGKIIITELPIGMEYKKYISILDDLVDDNFILSYKDCCDTYENNILFELKLSPSKYQEIIQNKDIDLYKILKLKLRETENYTCIDEHGRIKVFKSIYEILDYYIDIRLKYYVKRKEYLLNKLNNDLKIICSKYIFIKGVVDETINIKNKLKDDIIKQIENINKIIKIDNTYDYLLKMPLYSLTKEKLIELIEKIKQIKNNIDLLNQQTEYNLWQNDLKNLNIKQIFEN